MKHDRSVIGITNLLKAIFESCGMALDFSHINQFLTFDSITGYSLYNDILTTTPSTGTTTEPIYFYNIYMLQSMLWAINQDIATNHTIIDGALDCCAKKITCWDLVSKLSALFGFQFTFLNDTTLYVHMAPPITYSNSVLGEQLSISDSSKYELSIKSNISENINNTLYYEFKWIKASNIYHNYWNGSTQSNDYHLESPYDLGEVTQLEAAPTEKSATSTTMIDYYNNLVFYWVNNTLTSDGYSAYAIIPPRLSYLEIVTNGANYKTITYKTDIKTDKKALLQNKISIKDRTSEIMEETLI